MRRPAQHHLGPVARTAWAHPYTGVMALGVFYNGQPGTVPPAPAPTAPANPPVPTPAELAARAGQQPPATPPPASPAPAGGDEQMVTVTQRRLNVIMKDEKEEGRRAAYRAIAESAGIDPETFDPTKFGDVFKQAEQARQAQLSEEQRRKEDLDRREQEVQARLAAADQRDAETTKLRRTSQLEAALVRLGAVDVDEEHPNLQDAFAMLERDLAATPEADPAKITEAADKLKLRRPELFGAATAPQTLPPAPSGAPAGGGAPRQPASGKNSITEAANARAERMGLRKPAA